MTTDSRSIAIGVFKDRSMAEQALQALHEAGFDRDQILYSGKNSSDFFADLKSFFTGQPSSEHTLGNALIDMGLPEEEAQYYDNEYRNGNEVIAVKAPERVQDAMTLLHRHGAYNYSYNYNPDMAQPSTATNQQPVASPVPPPQYNANPGQQMTQNEALQRQLREMQAQLQAAHQREAQLQAQLQANQTQSQQNQQNQQADAAKRDAQLKTMHTQLQDTLAQLKDLQAQLQAAKQREAELQASRQQRVPQNQQAPSGDAQFQDLQRQLRDAQLQLQATQSQLQETQAHIAQMSQ